jgi:hypothetical protein
MTKRIWLVGSGPSLKVTPMDLLIGEDVMVMNKFGRIHSALGWRMTPTHYLKIDHNSIDMSQVEEIRWAEVRGCKLYLWEMFKTGFPIGHPNYDTMPSGVGTPSNTTWIQKCKHTGYQWNNTKAVQAWHFPTLCTAFGGMSTMIQIAVMEGYEEIYLLGCDLDYTPMEELNHAISDYTRDLRDKSAMDNGNMLTLHQMALRSSHIPIFNATIGGKLEVYPRVDMKEVLYGKKESIPGDAPKPKRSGSRTENGKGNAGLQGKNVNDDRRRKPGAGSGRGTRTKG